MVLWSARPVIGGSGGAQRCDADNVMNSGEIGEEHLCAEERRWAVRVSVVKEHLCAALSRKPKCMMAILGCARNAGIKIIRRFKKSGCEWNMHRCVCMTLRICATVRCLENNIHWCWPMWWMYDYIVLAT